MQTISIMNHKGGTGKTTSSINNGAGLAKKGHKVLLLDIDSKANLTEGLGIEDARHLRLRLHKGK
ncbi:MAG: AAA family ATPase [Algoriphagus sp.]|uniref:ParA family protein n=1 Tax=Algoriphagus sp. TaxID=1872435 RepID=UPI00262DA9DD|nr:AAA family ATPase [Algoriphagus sp.]MDG1277887.1 AAA family ATPase [Algoriphagus sp.]